MPEYKIRAVWQKPFFFLFDVYDEAGSRAITKKWKRMLGFGWLIVHTALYRDLTREVNWSHWASTFERTAI